MTSFMFVFLGLNSIVLHRLVLGGVCVSLFNFTGIEMCGTVMGSCDTAAFVCVSMNP